MSLSRGQAEWLVDFMRHLPGSTSSQGNTSLQGEGGSPQSGIVHHGSQAFYTDADPIDQDQMQQPYPDYDSYGDY